MPEQCSETEKKRADRIEQFLNSTRPNKKRGRPHKLEDAGLTSRQAKANALRTRRSLDEARALLFLRFCEIKGYLLLDECDAIMESGKAEMREIGHQSFLGNMVKTALDTADEIQRRSKKPRSGWDIEGFGNRCKPRGRIREAVVHKALDNNCDNE